MLTTTASDGTSVHAYDEGEGPPILLLHPGLSDGTRCKRLARILVDRGYRVLRLNRRQYRLDLPACTVAEEVSHVLAVVSAVGTPVLIYGHSDGGVIALESLVAAPDSFAGAVIFEPAVVTDQPLARPDTVARARAALPRHPGKALEVFSADAGELPAWQAKVVGWLVTMIPKYRRLAASQIDSLEALERLGNRLAAYAGISVPIVLLEGGASLAHIKAKVAAVAGAIPAAERAVMPRRDHGADLKAPGDVAAVISSLAEKVLR